MTTTARRLGIGSRFTVGVVPVLFVFLALRAEGSEIGPTVRASVGPRGVPGDGASRRPCLSADGRWVAFASDASNLVPGDGNAARDIFVRDRAQLRTERVSLGPGGAEADGGSFHASLSADARLVAFESLASNLVPGDGNGLRDIYVRDRESESTLRASVSWDGTDADGASFAPALSADGRVLAFRSAGTNLVADDANAKIDVFVRDLEGGATHRVSVASSGEEANGDSGAPSVSATGRFVAFESAASNLVAGDDNGTVDVFVRDLAQGTTSRVSVSSSGVEANDGSRAPSISGDGRYVAFESDATNLVAGDGNSGRDVFLHDRWTGTTVRVSVATGGGEGDGESREPSLGASGDRVAFTSEATDLVAGDGNAAPDVFLRDLATAETTRVSESPEGGDADAGSGLAALSDDGNHLAFESEAGNLAAGDANGLVDIFVRPLEDDAALRCRSGSVDAGSGPAVDVLLVNGSPGEGTLRSLVVAVSGPFEVFVAAPPSKPQGPSPFVLYAWLGACDTFTTRVLPYELGLACMPMPLAGGTPPTPRAIWNNIGKTSWLGAPTHPSVPAPSVVVSRPGGVGKVADLVLQGILVDEGAPGGRAAATNAVEVHVR